MFKKPICSNTGGGTGCIEGDGGTAVIYPDSNGGHIEGYGGNPAGHGHI